LRLGDVRELVAALYVVGAVVTAAGVLLAYRRARRDLRRLDGVASLHESHEDLDPTAEFDAALLGDEEAPEAGKLGRGAQQAELDRAVKEAGIQTGPPTIKDFSLPMEYWAKRSALRDAVESFRSGGLVALTGLAISTLASIWSLYLPTG
jgi:hypothetical protein